MNPVASMVRAPAFERNSPPETSPGCQDPDHVNSLERFKCWNISATLADQIEVKGEESLMTNAAFSIGQLVHHKLFDYRGVVYDVDPIFQGEDEWYQQVAKTRPPKDKPWYRVLVHGQLTETYVAERNLEPDTSKEPVDHPLVGSFFDQFSDGVYVRKQSAN